MTSTSNRRRVWHRLVLASAIAASTLGWHAGARAEATAAAPAAQSTSERGVIVKVTPNPAPAGATEWEFAVVLDTHSEELADDLAKSSVLLVDGREIWPSQWSGAAPGGHHREGVLKFAAPDQPAATLELRIQRVNEATPRVFRWDGAVLR